MDDWFSIGLALGSGAGNAIASRKEEKRNKRLSEMMRQYMNPGETADMAFSDYMKENTDKTYNDSLYNASDGFFAKALNGEYSPFQADKKGTRLQRNDVLGNNKIDLTQGMDDMTGYSQPKSLTDLVGRSLQPAKNKVSLNLTEKLPSSDYAATSLTDLLSKNYINQAPEQQQGDFPTYQKLTDMVRAIPDRDKAAVQAMQNGSMGMNHVGSFQQLSDQLQPSYQAQHMKSNRLGLSEIMLQMIEQGVDPERAQNAAMLIGQHYQEQDAEQAKKQHQQALLEAQQTLLNPASTAMQKAIAAQTMGLPDDVWKQKLVNLDNGGYLMGLLTDATGNIQNAYDPIRKSMTPGENANYNVAQQKLSIDQFRANLAAQGVQMDEAKLNLLFQQYQDKMGSRVPIQVKKQVEDNMGNLATVTVTRYRDPQTGAIYESPTPTGSGGKYQYVQMLNNHAEKLGCDQKTVNIFQRMVGVESGWNPNAVSSAGAMGLTQLMPDTAKSLGISNPKDPNQSLYGGLKYFNDLVKRYNGNHELAVAAYNAGPGNVDKYRGVPPFAETEKYVDTVLYGYSQQQEKEQEANTGDGYIKIREKGKPLPGQKKTPNKKQVKPKEKQAVKAQQKTVTQPLQINDPVVQFLIKKNPALAQQLLNRNGKASY